MRAILLAYITGVKSVFNSKLKFSVKELFIFINFELSIMEK